MESSPDGRSRKKQQPTEAPRGPSWGARSFSASKNYAINKAMKESGKDPGYGDFGRYFNEKKRKLRGQYHEDASTSLIRDTPAGTIPAPVAANINDKLPENSASHKVNKDLFKGVAIFVDGFTTPTHQELRFIMMNHGGIFENYFSSQRVTHIICSTLPDSKIMNPRLMSRGVPIVKPQWIVDSMEANRLLSWDTYQLERIVYSDPHQRTLSASFSAHKTEKSSVVKAESAERTGTIRSDVEVKDLRDDSVTVNNMGLPTATKLLEQECAGTLDEVSKVQDLVPSLSASKLQGGLTEPEMSYDTSKRLLSNEDFPGKQAKDNVADRRGRSTLNDPDFVHTYFKYSRLHFIGTWRNRYQSLVSAGSFGKPENVQSMGNESGASSSSRPVIIHLDMDCFFVSVVVRCHPDLRGKPVAVCHSDSTRGTAEISSANYPARSYGIKAGMFIRNAKARCPELAILPYDFAAYEQVADNVYSILHRHCSKVQAVSCDEAFLDVSDHPDPVNLALKIREEIFQSTQCTASAGIAENLLLARLATKKAKPNGQYFIQPHEVKQFMAALPVDELPGVGWTLREKLHAHGLYTCSELQSLSKEVLQKDYGMKTGAMLWSYAQGLDDREVQPAQERKSIGAEVNWGVRFSCMDNAEQFLVRLGNEVAARMQSTASYGRTITLKVKRRKEGIGEPVKYMGCGECDNMSRSETVGYATNSAEVLIRISLQLFASLHLDVQEVRGVGLQVSRLESANTGTRKQHNVLESWLAPTIKPGTGHGVVIGQITKDIQSGLGKLEENHIQNPSTSSNGDVEGLKQQQGHFRSDIQLPVISKQTLDEFQVQQQTNNKWKKKERKGSLELPPLSQLDHSVLEFLPEDIVAEINNAKRAQEMLNERDHVNSKLDSGQLIRPSVQKPDGRKSQSGMSKNKSKLRSSFLNLPPVSHLDRSVLESLPEDILAEINDAYQQDLLHKPSKAQASNSHSDLSSVPSADSASIETVKIISVPGIVEETRTHNDSPQSSENISGDSDSTAEGWTQPPVPFGQTSFSNQTGYEDYLITLRSTLESLKSGQSCQRLSTHLLSLGICPSVHDNRDLAGIDHLIQPCMKLVIQYIQAVASEDLEEVHLVILYIKRLGTRCKFWKAVQELTLPVIKDVVGEHFGGELTVD